MDRQTSFFREWLLKGVVGGLAATAVTAGTKVLLGEGAAAADYLIIIFVVAFAGMTGITHLLLPKARSIFWREVTQSTGLVRVFRGITACQEELLPRLQAAQDVRIFLQLGMSVLAGRKSIYEFLESLELRPETRIRIMHASPVSPYLTTDMARRRRTSDHDKWVSDIEHARNQIAALRRRFGDAVQVREHCEPFVWRLFILDDVAFVQPYVYDRKNSERASVLKIVRHDQGDESGRSQQSLFEMTARYFEAMWERYPTPPAGGHGDAPATTPDIAGPGGQG